jgi:hypothetical protein
MIPLFQRQSVDYTSELNRIIDLPRRTWTEQELEELADRMTALLKTPQGTERLRPAQALALHDLGCNRGLAAIMRVGSGKTLVSLLAPYMVNSVRPVLLLPAALIGKTEREMKRLMKHWRITAPKMISYEMLGRVQGADLLDPDPSHRGWRPDFIGADEVHKLKNKNVARTRRVGRFLSAWPDTIFAAYSGTFMKHSIKDCAHILHWCLGLEDAPIPRTEGEISEWADAIDEKVPALARRGAGALLRLCNDEEKDLPPLQAARRGFQRRLTETHGVVTTAGDTVACSLIIRALPYKMAPSMEALYDKLRNQMLTPDDWDLTMATEVWAVARQMALGFHGVWDPRPPQPWRVCRKIWAKFVRDQLRESDHLDTELQVRNAAARGEIPSLEYKAWRDMEPSFDIHTKDVWHDTAALDICAKWMKEGPGLVWCQHVFFAEELARRTGAEYYRQDGKNKRGQFVEDADCSKAIIISFDSCKEGRNLQGRPPSASEPNGWKGFSRNLITALPSAADDMEQMLGRTHRDGQLEDEVTADFLLGCKEHWDAWNSVIAGAVAARDTLGSPQKVLLALADAVVPTQAEMDTLRGSMWRADPKKQKSLLSELLGTATE